MPKGGRQNGASRRRERHGGQPMLLQSLQRAQDRGGINAGTCRGDGMPLAGDGLAHQLHGNGRTEVRGLDMAEAAGLHPAGGVLDRAAFVLLKHEAAVPGAPCLQGMPFERGQLRLFSAGNEQNLVRFFDGLHRELRIRLIGEDQREIELKFLLLQPMGNFGQFQRQRTGHAGPETLPAQDPHLGHALKPREQRVLRAMVQAPAGTRRADRKPGRRRRRGAGFPIVRAHAEQDGANKVRVGLERGGQVLPAQREKHGLAQRNRRCPRRRPGEKGRRLRRFAAPGLVRAPRGKAAGNDNAEFVHGRSRNRGGLPLGKHFQRAEAVKRLQLRRAERRKGGYLREELNIGVRAFHGPFLMRIRSCTKLDPVRAHCLMARSC